MLSVLIPTYNYNVFPLVLAIHKQLEITKIEYEIIAIDDASKSHLNQENQKVNTLSYCSFTALKKNIGRSAIRNLLASKAKKDWLLFLDGDVLPSSDNFITNYLTEIKKNTNKVFCGGVKYQRNPEYRDFLHYKHGINNEEIPVQKRKKQAAKYFFTSNFLISKAVFEKVKFEEKLVKYGREDLLFAIDLESKGIDIMHISNEIFHLGIVDNVTFVEKTKQAMENLDFLQKEGLIQSKETKLLNLQVKLQKVKLNSFFGNLNSFFERKAIQNKSLFYLDCLKLSYLCYLNQRKNG